jgi:hypothetical protein
MSFHRLRPHVSNAVAAARIYGEAINDAVERADTAPTTAETLDHLLKAQELALRIASAISTTILKEMEPPTAGVAADRVRDAIAEGRAPNIEDIAHFLKRTPPAFRGDKS